MNGDDEYGAGPYQQAVIDTLKRAPALSTPTQGLPKPNTRQRAYDEMEKVRQLIEQRPDVGELERTARGRYEAAGEDIGPAILLQALGGKLAPLGGQILQRSLAARGPQKVTGGEIVGGKFIEDPYHAQQRKIQGGQVLARTLESTAQHEETQAATAEARRVAQERQAAEDRFRRDQLAESRATRGETARLARERFDWEKGKGEEGAVQVVTDPITGQSALVNKRTGETRPLSVTGRSAVAQDILPKNATNEEKKLYGTAATTIDRAKQLITEVEANAEAFGPVIGRSETLRQTTGLAVPGMRLKPEQEKIRAGVYSRAYQTINELAGAALSAAESGRIMQFVPGPNDDVQGITAKLSAAIEEAETQRSTLQRRYNVPGGAPPEPDVPRGTPVGSVPEVSREPTKRLPQSPAAPGGAGWSIVR